MTCPLYSLSPSAAPPPTTASAFLHHGTCQDSTRILVVVGHSTGADTMEHIVRVAAQAHGLADPDQPWRQIDVLEVDASAADLGDIVQQAIESLCDAPAAVLLCGVGATAAQQLAVELMQLGDCFPGISKPCIPAMWSK